MDIIVVMTLELLVAQNCHTFLSQTITIIAPIFISKWIYSTVKNNSFSLSQHMKNESMKPELFRKRSVD